MKTRRDLLRTGWKAGGTLLAAAAAWTSWELLHPLTAKGEGGTIKLGDPKNFKAGTATEVRAGRLWVANTGKVLLAISQKCPHLGCRVPFCDSSGHFECPCHGSVFDIAGEWIEGPAPRGMDRYPLSIESGALVVDTSKTITGPDRGSKAFFLPAKGPKCKGA